MVNKNWLTPKDIKLHLQLPSMLTNDQTVAAVQMSWYRTTCTNY